MFLLCHKIHEKVQLQEKIAKVGYMVRTCTIALRHDNDKPFGKARDPKRDFHCINHNSLN